MKFMILNWGKEKKKPSTDVLIWRNETQLAPPSLPPLPEAGRRMTEGAT